MGPHSLHSPQMGLKSHSKYTTQEAVLALYQTHLPNNRAWPTAALLGQPPAPSFQKGSYLSLSFQCTHSLLKGPLQKLILPTPAAAGWFSAMFGNWQGIIGTLYWFPTVSGNKAHLHPTPRTFTSPFPIHSSLGKGGRGAQWLNLW